MAKTKQQKQVDLDELTKRLSDAKSVVIAEYRGSTVKDMDKFRRTLSKENVETKVYKVTLLRKALEQNGIAAGNIDYKAPVILSLSQEDETAPARLVKNFSKEVKTISILSGIMDKHLVSREEVLALADLPSKDQLLAQVTGTIAAPLSGMVNVLSGNLRGLITVLNAIAQKS